MAFSDDDEVHEIDPKTFSYGLVVGQMPKGTLETSRYFSLVRFYQETPTEGLTLLIVEHLS
jgi:hypothetical protein